MSREANDEQARPVTEVEFVVRDSSHPFVDASRTEGCAFELAEMVPRDDGRYAEFFNVRGADPDRVVALASTHDGVDVTALREYDDGGLFEFTVSGNCPAFSLAELGALPRTVEGVDGEGRIVAEIPPQFDTAAVVEAFLAETAGAEFASKREKDAVTPLFTPSAFQQVVRTRLTDRQREVLEAAFEAGYYEWPRECTGEDVAERLGITSATFSEHVHAAERKLLAVLFADESSD